MKAPSIKSLSTILGISIIIIGGAAGLAVMAWIAISYGLIVIIASIIYGYTVYKSTRNDINKTLAKGIEVLTIGLGTLLLSAVVTPFVCFLQARGPVYDPSACIITMFVFLEVWPAAIIFTCGTLIFIIGLLRKWVKANP